MYKLVKRNVTLIEMMIVMFLIAMIIGVVAYNYQGTLEESKAFKTKTAKQKLTTILTVMVSNDPAIEENLESEWREWVKKSPLVQNPNDIIKDGWGQDFEVTIDDGRVSVESEKYREYLEKNPQSAFKDAPQEK